MKMNSLEHSSSIYWSLCRQHRNGRWNELATVALTSLLQSSYESLKIRAAELWYKVSSNASQDAQGR